MSSATGVRPKPQRPTADAQGRPPGPRKGPPIPRSALSNLRMAAGNERRIRAVIMDGHVHRWVGIGWVDEGEPMPAQLRRLPVVED